MNEWKKANIHTNLFDDSTSRAENHLKFKGMRGCQSVFSILSKLNNSYKKYIENFFREKLKLRSTPLFIDFRESDNPFRGKPNLLTSKQKKKRTRMIKRSKK